MGIDSEGWKGGFQRESAGSVTPVGIHGAERKKTWKSSLTHAAKKGFELKTCSSSNCFRPEINKSIMLV